MDYLVVGAGPAGLQLGWLLHRAGRDYLVIEAGPTPGTFYRTFPRHRRMISINKPHTGWEDPELNLRMDWNSLLSDDPSLRFTRYTDRYFPDADDYVRYLGDYAAKGELNVECDTRVTSIARRDDGAFAVTDHRGDVRRAKRVIVATGFGRAFVPPIPGIEAAESYGDVSTVPDDFTNQRVLIIGKGNSAFETADNLIERAAVIHVVGPRSINFAWRTHFVGHVRAVNNNFLDTYQLKSQNMVLDATIVRIERRGDEFDVTLTYSRRDKTVELTYDRVIACTGFAMDASVFDETCRPELTINERFPALTSSWESVNVPDLYFAGTLTQSRDFKKYSSAFIKGFRYGTRALQRMLDRKYEGVPWPSDELAATPEAIAAAVLARINRTSGLWQQYSFLCDLVEITTVGARYYEEVPVDHVLDGDFGVADRFVTVTLEYGAGHDAIDPFDVDIGRAWEADAANDVRYLHPVLRYYEGTAVVSVLALPEDVCNDWSRDDTYRAPIVEFLAAVLTSTSRSRDVGAPVNVREFEAAARAVIDPVHYDYFAGGAQDEITVRANESAFGRVTLVPRVLRGAGVPELDVTVLGTDMAMPILLAPTAFHRLAHPEAERATARAAAAAGVTMIAAMLSTVAIEDIAAESRKTAAEWEPTLWFQIYVQPDLGFTEAIVRRAETAGCRALVVTVDSAALGRAERNDRNDFHDLPPGLRCENLRELRGGEPGSVRQVVLSPDISWSHIEWLRGISDLPILLKGVLHPLDAHLAVEHGVDGVIVSNHGGRQLDSTPATIDQLPLIVEAVEQRLPVLLDGGVRRGTDVVKALALGATAVAVGRPAVWGLAAGGEAGVARVLALLRNELDNALRLCGCDSPRAISHDLIGRLA